MEPRRRGRRLRTAVAPLGEGRRTRHDVALWAGLTALFSNLAAVGIVDLIGSDNGAKALGVLVASLIVGATVYSKQRWDDAKGQGEMVDPDES